MLEWVSALCLCYCISCATCWSCSGISHTFQGVKATRNKNHFWLEAFQQGKDVLDHCVAVYVIAATRGQWETRVTANCIRAADIFRIPVAFRGRRDMQTLF